MPEVLARSTSRQTDFPSALPSQNDATRPSHRTPTSTASPNSPTSLTPHRGRPTNRYPDSLARVPLHKRGTSKTYERLEDLLREAGYRETRVFTPETDQDACSATEKHEGATGSTVRGSVGAIVDFFAGLVSRGSSLSRETTPLEDDSAQPGSHPWSPPPSPLAHALHIRNDRAKRVASVASLSTTGSSKSTPRRTNVAIMADPSRPSSVSRVVQSPQGLHQSIHRSHHHYPNRRHPLNNYSSKSSSTKPNTPNARTNLRHMVSAPNIQPLIKLPSCSEASSRSYAIGRGHQIGSGTRPPFILDNEASLAQQDDQPRTCASMDVDEHQVHPPLPRNWIESVAKALLSGVSGPAAVISDTASTRTAQTASTQKSLALTDKSNQEERGRVTTRAARPPLLCIQVQDVKARTSDSQVACTRVMCRSTPSSRASSRVRNSGHDHMISTNNRRRGVDDKSRNRRGKHRNVVPSLARTKTENDDWMEPRHRYSGGWGVQGGTQVHPDGAWFNDSDDEDDDDDDDDDEGELDLNRLLVPARRQHSIQSLRKHLQRPRSRILSGHRASLPGSPRSGRASPFGGAPASGLDWADASCGAGRGWEWSRSQGEDEDAYDHVLSSGTKWGRGLPGLVQWTTSS